MDEENVKETYLDESAAVVYIPPNAIELTLQITIYQDGELFKCSKTMDNHQLRQAFEYAELYYDDPDVRYVVTEKGLQWLKQMEKQREARCEE